MLRRRRIRAGRGRRLIGKPEKQREISELSKPKHFLSVLRPQVIIKEEEYEY